MIALILPLVARLGVHERFQKLAAWVALILIALALLWLAKMFYDRAVIRDHEREIVEEVREKTVKGNAAAHRTVQEVREGIEQDNRRASDAAKDSDDPLKSAFDELRK